MFTKNYSISQLFFSRTVIPPEALKMSSIHSFIRGSLGKTLETINQQTSMISQFGRILSKVLLLPQGTRIFLFYKGINKIPCDCASVYIGESRPSIQTILKEDQRYDKTHFSAHSALADHFIDIATKLFAILFYIILYHIQRIPA